MLDIRTNKVETTAIKFADTGASILRLGVMEDQPVIEILDEEGESIGVLHSEADVAAMAKALNYIAVEGWLE